MRRLFFSVIFFFCFGQSNAKQDTLSYNQFKNEVSIEAGGGSYDIFSFGNPINLGYGRLFYFKENKWLVLSSRIGIGQYKASVSPPPRILKNYFIPVESGVLLGNTPVKVKVGFGYTPVFGEQEIRSGSYGNPHLVTVNFYDFWTLRLGVTFIPRKTNFIYASLEWTPVKVTAHNPLPYDITDRIRLDWVSLELGISF